VSVLVSRRVFKKTAMISQWDDMREMIEDSLCQSRISLAIKASASDILSGDVTGGEGFQRKAMKEGDPFPRTSFAKSASINCERVQYHYP